MRHTMLHHGRDRELPRRAVEIGRKDIDLSHDIAVSAETTLSAAIDSAAWFVPIAAVGTGLAGVVLILKHHSDAFCLGFVLDICADFAMAPSADFLVALLGQIDAISHSTDIAQDDGACLPFDSDLDNGPADFVLHVPQHPRMLGFHPHLRTHQALVPPGAPGGPTEGLREGRQPFVVALPGMPTCPAGDKRGFIRIAHNSRMHFAQIKESAKFRGDPLQSKGWQRTLCA